jgi:NAD(P)-dependent dehydrogenase (short-subunit alcohol dehydrogenase family)
MKVPFKLSEGFELQQKVNHFSHFVFLNSVMNLIEKSDKARIISLSSMAHKMGNGKFQYWRTFESQDEYKTVNYNLYSGFEAHKLCNITYVR